MNLVDRFTRDRVSRVVWGLFVVAALGLLSLAVVNGRRAANDERAASQLRAAGYAKVIVEPAIAQSSLEESFANGALEQLRSAVEGGVLVDPRVVAVRLWAPNGSLLFSTAPDDARDSQVASQVALNDEHIRLALTDAAPVTVAGRSPAEDPDGASELVTYVPVTSGTGAQAVVEVAHAYDATVGAVGRDWLRLQLFAGALVLAFLVLTILSFREPVAKIGAGVGFVAEAVPPGYAVIEEERLRAVNDVYGLAQERVNRLKERLRMAEESRLAAEGELQRVLSRFESPKRAPGPSFPPVVAQAASKASDPAPISEPEPERASLKPAPVEAPSTEGEVVGEPMTERAEPEPVEPEPVEPEPVEPEPVEPEPVEPEPVVLSEPLVAASVDSHASSPIGEIVELQDDDEDDAAIARELLLRLMETEIPMADTGVDPGEVRAKLVRTAARKKPGGGERRLTEEETSHQGPPWARNR